MADNKKLLSAEQLSQAEVDVEHYKTLGRYFDAVSITADGYQPSENHGEGMFLESSHALTMTKLGNAVYGPLFITMLLGCIFGGVSAGTSSVTYLNFPVLAGWVAGLAAAAAIAASIYVIAEATVERLRKVFALGEQFPVSSAMRAGWNTARATIEAANENTTVPDVLTAIAELHSELRCILQTYGEVIDPVAKSQMENDFLYACALVEQLKLTALARQNELYAGNRERYLTLLEGK